MRKWNKKRKRKGKMIFLYFFATLIYIFCCMQIATSSIYRDLSDAFYCTDYYVRESDYNMNPDAYINNDIETFVIYHDNPHFSIIGEPSDLQKRYNYTGLGIHFAKSRNVTTKLHIYYFISFHNFRKGVIYCRYSCNVTDEYGKDWMGSWNVPVKMDIVKENGTWQISEIWEEA